MSEGDDYKILNVTDKAFEEYKKIIKLPAFNKISGLQNKHLFILAMVLGFKHTKHVPLGDKHSGGYCRVETLSDEDNAIIQSIAINKTEDINVLIDPKRQYQIAEAYANGGISILKELITKSGDFFTNLEAELRKANRV